MTELPRYPRVHVGAPDEEAAEELAYLLFELGASGVETRDRGTLDGPEGDAYATLVGHFEQEAEAEEAVRALRPRFEARVEFLIGDAWREAWKEFFKPSLVGARIWIRPPWEPPPARAPGQIEVILDPGQAFGTGTHQTTRLVLAALAALSREPRGLEGRSVLDLGCGSGILAIAALLLGADRALCLDIEEESVRAARENALVNGVEGRLRAHLGELSALDRIGAREPFSLILANIRGPILEPLAGALIARLAPGGRLALSGILREEEGALRRAYASLGEPARSEEGEWISLLFTR